MFRLPLAPSQRVEVSDRFRIGPLVPLMAFPSSTYFVALASCWKWMIGEEDVGYGKRAPARPGTSVRGAGSRPPRG
jgi:hypothetical protein